MVASVTEENRCLPPPVRITKKKKKHAVSETSRRKTTRENKKNNETGSYVPPVLTPALPRRRQIMRIRRNVRRGRVVARVSDCRGIERPIGNVTSEGRMVPKLVLIEQLKARHVEQGVERCPEIAVVARGRLKRGAKHLGRHSPA